MYAQETLAARVYNAGKVYPDARRGVEGSWVAGGWTRALDELPAYLPPSGSAAPVMSSSFSWSSSFSSAPKGQVRA